MLSNRICRARQMRRAIAAHPHSGLTITAFCKKRHIPLSTFLYWRKLVLLETGSAPAEPPAPSNPGFVRIIPETNPAIFREGCELAFPDGRILKLPADYPLESLLAVLKAGTV